jgi:hypothetical protein
MGANAFPGVDVERNLVDSTIAEVRRDRPVDAARVLARLQDWKIRVDRLYDFFESALGSHSFMTEPTSTALPKTRCNALVSSKGRFPWSMSFGSSILRGLRERSLCHAPCG